MAMISTFPVATVTLDRAADARGVQRGLVIGAPLFRSALIRERKRADRSNESFLVLVISSRDGDIVGPPAWVAAIDAVNAAKRTSDILGWYSDQTALGVILTDAISHDRVDARELEARFRRELEYRLAPPDVARLSLRFHAHVPGLSHGANPIQAFEPLEPIIAFLNPGATGAAVARGLKRGLDVAGSAGLLILSAPLLLVIAALIKVTSRGPVFFRQTRIGQNGRPFTMLKFRTMHVGVDHAIHHEFVTKFITASESINEPVKDARFKIAHDPRVTRIGGFLRKTSLDEFPQFWNVLNGEMSLVGPRPPLAYEVEKYQPWHCRRVLDAKPGITGLWQVKGRSRTTFDEMVRLDLRYARTHSFWQDVKILLATPGAVISGKGAA